MVCMIAGYRFDEESKGDAVSLRLDLVLTENLARRVDQMLSRQRAQDAMSLLANALPYRVGLGGYPRPSTYPETARTASEARAIQAEEDRRAAQQIAEYAEFMRSLPTLLPAASFTVGFVKQEPEKKVAHTLAREIDIPEEK